MSEGINITDGVPSEIHVAIGRGRYTNNYGFTNEYELARDVAEAVRAEQSERVAALEKEVQRLTANYPGGDQDAQARSWSAVWAALARAGMLTVWSETTNGRDRALEFIQKLAADRQALQKFKDWTHAYLDGKGVPHHPPGTHGAAGCRIGDRMDYVFAERDSLRAACEAAMAVLPGLEVRSWPPGHKMKKDAIAKLRAVLASAEPRTEATGGGVMVTDTVTVPVPRELLERCLRTLSRCEARFRTAEEESESWRCEGELRAVLASAEPRMEAT